MDERPDGMSVERAPRTSPVTVAAGAGLLWGAFCYSVLWNGTPFGVDRRFVESVRGTLVLLPARLVLWAVHAGETVAGRTFQLADSTWLFAVASSAVGLVLGVVVAVAVRALAAAIRR